MFGLLKYRTTALFISLCIATLSSCIKSDIQSEDDGEFSLSLAADDVLVETTTKSTEEIDVSAFKVQISTVDQSHILKEWEKYSDVPDVVKFGKGNYIIKAFGGDSTTTDFDAVSYSGVSKLSVYKSETQTIHVLCKLNKMAVTVELEPNMKLYYANLSTEVTASAKSKLNFGKDETRRGYFPVNPLSAKIYLTRKDGTMFEAIMPQIKDTKAGEHYIISFNTKGGIGTVSVSVREAQTNDIIIESDIPTEAITNLPPYFVASSGFTLESPVVSINETATADVRMLIKARGYIKKCIIGVKSAYLISKGVPREFDLTTTTSNAELATILKNVGMTWSNNMSSSTIAEIDFSGMLALLPAETDNSYDHIMSLRVEDNYQRFSDKLDLHLSVSYPIVEIERVSRVAEINSAAEVDLECVIENGSFANLNRVEILDGFTWKTLPTNQYTLEINSSNAKKAMIKIKGLPIQSAQFSFRLVHKNPTIGIERFSEQITAYLVTPKIILSVLNPITDRHGNIRVQGQHDAQINVKIETTDATFNFDANKLQLKVRNQGVWENVGRVVSSDNAAKTAVMEVSGLTPSEKYRIRCIYDGRYSSFNEGIFQTDGFHFEDWGATQSFANVEYGGRIGWKKHYNNWGTSNLSNDYEDYEKISISADNISDGYWSTTGSKTIKADFRPYNTWYMVPSVLKTSGQSGNGVSLRSVAWDNKGPAVADGDISKISDPSKPLMWQTNTNYNTRDQVPATDLSDAFKASAKLFLGQYSCIHDATGKDPNETYTENGLKLKTKPIGVNFYYKFTSCGGDTGVARAVVYDAAGYQIGVGELIISSDVAQWNEATVLITYASQAKADRIAIMFASSSADKLPSRPTAQMQAGIKLMSDHITTRNAMGNVLSIDEVELKY